MNLGDNTQKRPCELRCPPPFYPVANNVRITSSYSNGNDPFSWQREELLTTVATRRLSWRRGLFPSFFELGWLAPPMTILQAHKQVTITTSLSQTTHCFFRYQQIYFPRQFNTTEFGQINHASNSFASAPSDVHN